MCVEIVFQAFGCSMQTIHLSCINISTISKQTEPSIHLSPFTQEYQHVRLKWFLRLWCIRCKLCTYLAPKLTMSPNDRKEIPYDTRHQGLPSGASKLISKHMVCFHANHAPTLHKDQHYLQTGRTKLPLEPLHLGVPNSASKMVSQTMVNQAQTVHLSCTKTYNVYKQTEARFHMTHVIQKIHWVRSNLFLSIWYVPCKSCTYLASRLALSQNRSN